MGEWYPGASNGGSVTDLALANGLPARSNHPDISKLTASTGTALTVQTGYTGNDITEPTVLYDSRAPFAGFEYVLCAAPYYQSNAAYENPCLWVSHDGTAWYPIKFATAATTTSSASGGSVDTGYAGGYPVTPVVASGAQGDGNNSDPTLVRGADGTYYIIWNQFLNPTGSGGTGTGSNDWAIKVVSASSLLGPWSTPTTVSASVSGTFRPSSPSAFYDGSQWHVYAVDTHTNTASAINHWTAAQLTGAWTQQTNPTIAVPSAYSTQIWWHLNAYRWGNLHVLIMQDSTSGSSGAGNLWALTSSDGGVTWTVPTAPMLTGGNWYRTAAVFTDVGLGSGLDLFYGTIGTYWTLNRTTASWKSSAIEPQFPPTGFTYRIGPSFGTAGNITPTQGTAYAAPVLIYKQVPISAIGALIASAGGAGSVVRLGLYADNGNGLPGSLLFDAGTIDGTSATFQEIAVTKTLLPGLYWIVAVWQVGTVGTIGGVSGLSPLVCENPSTAAQNHRAAYTKTSVTGALPASFGTPASHDVGVRATLKIT